MSTNSTIAAENFRGCMFMLLAMASFAVGDTILKVVSSQLPLAQILVTRGIFAAVMLTIATAALQQFCPVRVIFTAPFLLRLLGEIVATAFFLTALFNMPIANASAIMQALPLTVSLGAAYFFGETIGWRRIMAIMIGFIGVLFIVQPGLEGFNAFSIYCLIGVAGTTLRDLATRKLDPSIPTLFVSLITVIVIILFGLILSFFQPWKPITTYELVNLGFASLFLISGFYTIVAAMRVGEVGVVTPFRYTVLIFAVILGILVFDEYPDTLTITGSFIVVASGIYTIFRERKLARQLAVNQ
ncbi:MAG: DMT family transporter [Pseudomonadota bacterium]